jgi:hypothetical protein
VHFPLVGIVFPAAEIGAPPLPRGFGGADPLAQGTSDDSDLAGLREFQRGDPPQRVAWKAVARGAGWFSKEFDGAGGGGPLALMWDALPANASRGSPAVAPPRPGSLPPKDRHERSRSRCRARTLRPARDGIIAARP